jgi:flagellar export protein FliJ
MADELSVEKTRLDPVVDLRERASDAVERELTSARAEAERREQDLLAAKARCAVDQRRASDAAEWQMIEAGHARSLQLVRAKEQSVKQQTSVVEKVRQKATQARIALEAVKRAADRKRTEQIQFRERSEARQLDAIATLLYSA